MSYNKENELKECKKMTEITAKGMLLIDPKLYKDHETLFDGFLLTPPKKDNIELKADLTDSGHYTIACDGSYAFYLHADGTDDLITALNRCFKVEFDQPRYDDYQKMMRILAKRANSLTIVNALTYTIDEDGIASTSELNITACVEDGHFAKEQLTSNAVFFNDYSLIQHGLAKGLNLKDNEQDLQKFKDIVVEDLYADLDSDNCLHGMSFDALAKRAQEIILSDKRLAGGITKNRLGEDNRKVYFFNYEFLLDHFE